MTDLSYIWILWFRNELIDDFSNIGMADREELAATWSKSTWWKPDHFRIVKYIVQPDLGLKVDEESG